MKALRKCNLTKGFTKPETHSGESKIPINNTLLKTLRAQIVLKPLTD